MKSIKFLGMALACCLSSGCESLRFYQQAAQGQWELLLNSTPTRSVIEDPATSAQLRARLQTIESMLEFAETELHLVVADRYQRYVHLEREYVVWNVFAAPPLSMRSEQWCYPLIGCAPYRGFFAEADARAFAARYKENGFDTYVGGVAAYSTLGWFDDSLLSTVVERSDYQLAGLVFHELAHQVAFAAGDTSFNESFATAVEREGIRSRCIRACTKWGTNEICAHTE